MCYGTATFNDNSVGETDTMFLFPHSRRQTAYNTIMIFLDRKSSSPDDQSTVNDTIKAPNMSFSWATTLVGGEPSPESAAGGNGGRCAATGARAGAATATSAVERERERQREDRRQVPLAAPALLLRAS
jgi:hypothetical protein